MNSRTLAWLRRTGYFAGAALAAAAVLSWRIPGGEGVPGAELSLVAASPEGLVVSPTDPFLLEHDLRPGGTTAEGTLHVRNVAGRPLAVRVQTLPETPDLDELVELELWVGGRMLASGRIGDLRRPSDGTLVLAPGESRTLRALARLPRGSVGGWQARSVEATVGFRVRPLEGM